MKLLQGKFLVKAVRTYLKFKLLKKDGDFELESWPAWCNQKSGVFVTLNSHPSGELRGCVGFPEPRFELKDALLESAFSAAFRDHRFSPLASEEEFSKSITVEVSVLAKPKRILAKDPRNFLESIEIGRDGLIVSYKRTFSGLLLPQVPVEWKWGKEEFVSRTCEKAGLPRDFWITHFSDLSFSSFQSEIFREKEPGGEIEKEEKS